MWRNVGIGISIGVDAVNQSINVACYCAKHTLVAYAQSGLLLARAKATAGSLRDVVGTMQRQWPIDRTVDQSSS
jgi:hypothetical protein